MNPDFWQGKRVFLTGQPASRADGCRCGCKPWGPRCTAMRGSDPYSSSKGCSELVTSAYRQSFLAASEIALASARAGNVIGGGDWASERMCQKI